MTTLSIVTGTALDRLSYLQAMVYSARRSIPRGVSYELIVVAGKYPESALSWCRQQSDIKLIVQETLSGAIHAFGAGFEIAHGKYTIIANDDITFVGDSIGRAIAFMEDHPDIGIGCFFQDRDGKGWHVDRQPAHFPGGGMTSIYYGQVCIIPTEIGHALGWWGHADPQMKRSRTYGGDNFLTSRAIEAGYKVEPIPSASIHDMTPQDALREINNSATLTSNQHPDTAVYLSIYPRGPELSGKQTVREEKRELRVLYAPIYEPGHVIQHEQKLGLRRALQRIGLIHEVDYLAGESLIDAARTWQPDLFIGQFHDGRSFTAQAMKVVKENVRWRSVNWNGDVYDRSTDADYIELLQQFDLHTVVNASAIPRYTSKFVRSAYWQVGFEPLILSSRTGAKVQWDIAFFGNGYSGSRQTLGSWLRALPYKTAIWGSSWPQSMANGDTLYNFYQNGELLRQTKIVVGDSQHYNSQDGLGFVSNRLFDTLAAGGALLLHQAFPGMEHYLNLKDGVHLVTWETFDDLREKIDYYLTHDVERSAIVQRGQLEVLRFHSFEYRVNQLFDILNRPNNVPPGVNPTVIDVTYV